MQVTSVHLEEIAGTLVARFLDCARLEPDPVKDLRQQFEERVQAGAKPDLIVDFQGIGFAGSSSLGGFVTLMKTVKLANGRLVLCELEPSVHDSFRISSLETLFRFVPSRDDALALLEHTAGPVVSTSLFHG